MTTWLPGDVATVEAFDAEMCPTDVPAGVEVAFVYIGGSSAASIWDQHERQRVQHLHKAPIWVPTPGREDPRKVAFQAAAQMAALGIPRAGEAPEVACHLFWDLETGKEPDPEWYRVAADRLRQNGYHSIAYGSLGYLFDYEQRAGYWPANPTGVAHLTEHPGVVAEQYAWNVRVPGGLINRDVVARQLLPGLWQPSAG